MADRPTLPPSSEDDLPALLEAAGARLFEFADDRRLQRLVPPASRVPDGLVGRDVRGLIDPLAPLNEHPEVARAVAAREPFRDLLVPVSVGTTTRMMRVSGTPRFDAEGTYRGYRGIAVDAGPPGPAAPELPAPLCQGLTTALGLIIGFGQFLQQEMAVGRPESAYLARLLAAAGVAQNIVASAGGAPAPRPSAGASPEPPGATRRGRVLLVQETPVIADLIAIALDRAGFETGVCRDAEEACEVLLEAGTDWDVLVTTARHALDRGGALIRTARRVRGDTLCVVCDEPGETALAEADVDACWTWPVDAAGLTRLIIAQLADLDASINCKRASSDAPVATVTAGRSAIRRTPGRDSYPAAPPSYPSAPV